jgi:osmotically inducible protein OsmC
MTSGGSVLYTAKTQTTGGRENGVARSADGYFKIRFSTPGTGWIGASPEQLLAAGWSASFESAIALAANNRKISPPTHIAIDAEVDLNCLENVFFLSIRLNVYLPGIERHVAEALAQEARQICPFSKATKGNIDVMINLF